MSKQFEIPIKGPQVTWDIEQVKRAVMIYGKEGAIKRLTGVMFKKKYITKLVQTCLDTIIRGKNWTPNPKFKGSYGKSLLKFIK